MTGKLYEYFGAIGLASTLAWLATLALCAASARHRRRHRRFFAALGLAVVAFVLAQVNSRRVSAIQTDRSEELQAARLAQQRARQAEAAANNPRVAGPRFAEDAPDGADSAAEPAWRQAGKQRREAGKIQPLAGEPVGGVEPAAARVRVMKETDVFRANRLDRYNLFGARFTLLVAALLVLWDYLARFGRAFENYFPIPIAGRWMLAMFSRPVMLSHDPSRRAELPALMESIVRRGETFLYFGERDPWTASVLPRWRLGSRTFSQLPKLVYGSDDAPRDPEFLFEAVWFDRSCAVVPDGGESRRLLPALREYLALRQMTRARAPKTVTLIWDCDAALDEPALRWLLPLARETNFQVVTCFPHAPV